MEKEKLLEAKEKILNMAIEDVNKGKYSLELLQIIISGICDIQQKEFEEKRKVEEEEYKEKREKNNKEYAELLAKMFER